MRDKLMALLEPELEKLGYELVELEFQSHGSGGTLRLYIDGPDGIGLDDCASVSHRVSGVLDVEDPIPGTYHLEVSSPGLDRPLRTVEHYERFAGERVKLQLLGTSRGRKRLTGRLVGIRDGSVRVEVEDEEWEIPLGDIERARLKPEI